MIGLRRGSAEPIRRLYAVGDVHGRLDLFQRLMNRVERDQAGRPPVATRVVLLGDIVDRGPDSAKMVMGCMNLTKYTNRFVVLKGNHEEMMVKALRGDLFVYGHWLRFGGKETLLSWGVDPAVVEGPATMDSLRIAAKTVGDDAIRWLAKLPLYHQHDDYLFVHAGIRPGIPLRRQRSDDLLWITEDFLDSDVSHDFIVVHGHTVGEDGPVIRSNRIGIDTGAYRTNRLTAMGVENGETWTLSTTLEPTASRASSDATLQEHTFQNPADSGTQNGSAASGEA
jgi:serine/threonine protein phosphatase 1